MRKKTILMNRLATVLAVIAVMVLATVSTSAYGYELSVSPGNGQLDGKQEIVSVTGGRSTGSSPYRFKRRIERGGPTARLDVRALGQVRVLRDPPIVYQRTCSAAVTLASSGADQQGQSP